MRREDFAEILVQRGHCGDSEEASVLADLVYQEITILSETTEDGEPFNPTDEKLEEWNNLIQEFFGVTVDQAKILLEELFLMEHEEEEDEKENEDDSESDVSKEDVSDEEEFQLFDGECELCDRCIRLTKHHLIPKSTWHRLGSRLRNAADAKQKGDIDRASMILGPGLMHTLDRLEPKRNAIKAIMCTTCDICP